MRNTYLMWFRRFGCLEMVVQTSLEDCLDLALMLDDADTAVF